MLESHTESRTFPSENFTNIFSTPSLQRAPHFNHQRKSQMPESHSEASVHSLLHSSTIPPTPTLQRAPYLGPLNTSCANGRFSPPINGRSVSPPITNLFSSQQLPPTCGARQISKLKRFLTTLIAFGNDIDSGTGERVRNLVLGLVNSTITIEEFQAKLQEATNFPLRPFVTPFLKANLPLLQRELHHCARLVKQTPNQFLLLNEHFLFEPALTPSSGSSAPTSTATTTGTTTGNPVGSIDHFSPLGGLSGGTRGQSGGYLHSSSSSSRGGDSATEITSSSEYRKRSALKDDRPGEVPDGSPPTKRSSPRSPPSSAPLLSPVASSANGPLNLSASVQFSEHFELERERIFNNISGFRPASGYTFGTMDDWRHLDDMLKTLPDLLTNISRTAHKLEERSRREREELLSLSRERHHSGIFGSSAADLNEVKRRADDAVSEVKRQAKMELQKLVAASEERAFDTLTRERSKLEKSVEEAKRKAHEEAMTLFTHQEESAENCQNCGRKASETCSGCNKARYCGSFCQHKDWMRHQNECGTGQEKKPLSVDCTPENLSLKIQEIPEKEPTPQSESKEAEMSSPSSTKSE